jgi:hypothetical protein
VSAGAPGATSSAAGMLAAGARAGAGALAAPAAGEGESFRIKGGQEGEELRLTASSGTPVVTLTSPSGQSFTTPSSAGQLARSGNEFMSAVAPDPHQVLVFLRHPQGGEWRLRSAPGSPPVSRLEGATDVAPASVRVRVRRSRAGRWSLAYAIAHHLAGDRVMFVERGRDSTHVLGTVAAAKGTIAFVPQDALSRARRIVAYLLDAQGAPQRVLTVGHYTAPGAIAGGRVTHVRILRHGLTALVSWPAAPRARVYTIFVRGSDGSVRTLRAKRSHRSVQLTGVLPFDSYTVKVAALGGPSLRAGATASAKLAPVKEPHVSHVRRRGRSHGGARRRHG